MELDGESITIHVEEETVEELQQSELSDYEELSEVRQCPVCGASFRLSTLLFQHMINNHKDHKRWKISDFINILEVSEIVYSSDSDCDYEINVEVTKTTSTKKEYEERMLALDYQREPLKVIDGCLSTILQDTKNDVDNLQDFEVRVRCPHCERTFSGRKNLRQHIKIYHVEETGQIDYDLSTNDKFKCPECRRELSGPRNMRKHMKLCHNMLIRFFGQGNSQQMTKRFINRSFRDTTQVVQNDTSDDFPIIRAKDDDTERNIYKCGICGYGPFFFARAIKRHQVKEHGREPLKMDIKDQVFRCEHCPKEFWKKDNLQRHMKLHSDAKNYVCNLCGDAFKTSAVLRKHRLAHINIKCLICNDEFKLRSDYKSHHKTEHYHQAKSFDILDAELDPPNKRMSHIPNKVEEPTKCERCHRVFSAMCGYKVHKCVDNDKEEANSTKKPKQTCELCGRNCKTKKGYREHKCPTRKAALSHVREVLICDIPDCGMIFLSAKEQLFHMEQMHEFEDHIEIIEEEIIT